MSPRRHCKENYDVLCPHVLPAGRCRCRYRGTLSTSPSSPPFPTDPLLHDEDHRRPELLGRQCPQERRQQQREVLCRRVAKHADLGLDPPGLRDGRRVGILSPRRSLDRTRPARSLPAGASPRRNRHRGCPPAPRRATPGAPLPGGGSGPPTLVGPRRRPRPRRQQARGLLAASAVSGLLPLLPGPRWRHVLPNPAIWGPRRRETRCRRRIPRGRARRRPYPPG